MKRIKNEKGFLASALLYVMLGLFLSLMIGVIAIYSNRKILLEKIKTDVIDELEQDNKLSSLVGEREDYFEAAEAYMGLKSEFNSFNETGDVSLISVNNMIKAGLLPTNIVSPLTNRKEVTQNNYVVAFVSDDGYQFTYVDNSAAMDYISTVNELSDRIDSLESRVAALEK